MVQLRVADDQATRVTSEQRWVLGLASLASFIVILDVMVVATALTAIRQHLGASLADLEWTVSAYTLSFAVLLMTAAALGDRLGRRRVFAAGLTLFAVSSAACALAPDAAALIAARAVQGAGAATIIPMALALLNGAFPPHRRGWAIGIYGGVTGLAAVAGPVLGGAVTQGLGWQWIFWLNVPVALAAVPLVLTRLRETKGTGAAVDLPGLVLVTAAALGLVWGLVRGNTAGWASPEVLGTLAGGAAATAVFAAWERRAARPMLPARLFRSPAFSAGNAAVFMINASLSGVIFLMPQFQQVVDGQDPLGSGLRLLPWGIAPFLVGPRAGALADRVGERALVVSGGLVQAAGVAWIAAVAAPGTSYLALVTPMILVGVGLALSIPAATRSVTSTVLPADIGTASAAFSTMRQLGGAFGVAVLGAAFAANGGYATPAAFSRGFTTALAVAAGLALAGTVAGTVLTGRRNHPSPAPSPEPGQVASALDRAAAEPSCGVVGISQPRLGWPAGWSHTGHPGLIKVMNSLSPLYSAKAGKAPRLLAVAGLAALAVTVTAPGISQAATGPAVPPLNGQALAQAIAGLPSSQQTAALVTVGGWSGRWSGASGLASIGTGTPALSDDEVRIGSISKTFIATVVLQLVAEHRISLDEPVQDYLPGLLRDGDPPVTIAELLNHTSGLGPADGVVNTGDPQWFVANRFGSYTTAQLLGPVLQEPLIFPPGTHQQYNGVNYIVLAMLIQRVTGHGYAQEIQQRVLGPLGMRHTYVPAGPAMPAPYLHAYDSQDQAAGAQPTDISQQDPSLYGAQGAMISTTGDLNTFMTALFRGRLLPKARLDDMFTIPAVAGGPFRYGMGLLSYTFPNGVTVWGHTGETPGYATGMFATRDLSRTLVFALTPVEPANPNQVLTTELAIAQAAYDPPSGG